MPDKKWLVIDAEGILPGRLAAFIATRLRRLPSADMAFNAHRDAWPEGAVKARELVPTVVLVRTGLRLRPTRERAVIERAS